MIAIVVFLVVSMVAGTAFAHSGLGAASPAPGAIVGGEITEIQLRFASTVADVDGSVTDPDSVELASTVTQDGNLRVTITLDEPLSAAGAYTVRHVSTDVADGDRVEASYQFTYDPSAPPPQLQVVPDDTGGVPWIWVVFGCGAVVIAGLGWRLAQSLRRARDTPIAS